MKKIKISTILVVIIFIILVSLSGYLSLRYLDRIASDFMTSTMLKINKQQAKDDVVLVMIDEKSIAKIPWSWPRTLYGDIFEYLQDKCGVTAVIQDNVVFVPDTYNPEADEKFFAQLPELTKLISAYDLYDTDNTTGDLLPEKNLPLFNEKSRVNIEDRRTVKYPSIYKGIFKLPKTYLENVPILAHYKIPRDNDGKIRKYMPVIEYEHKLYPSQALYGFAMKTGIYNYVLNDYSLCSADDECKALNIPIYATDNDDFSDNPDPGIYNTIKWYTPNSKSYSHKYYSAIDVLESKAAVENGEEPLLGEKEFKDKIVIISTNAPSGKLESVHPTNILKKHAFADMLATEIDNMLNNEFWQDKYATLTVFLTIFFWFLAIVPTWNKSLRTTFKAILVLGILYYILYYYLFTHNFEIAFATPIVFTSVFAVLKKAYRLITNDEESEKIKNIMSKYISQDVMNNVLDNMESAKVGGYKSEATIMFVDIRDFTSISENLSAQEVTGLLNRYFSTLEPIITKHKGLINKYIGDAVMVIFGQPVRDEKHALHAVQCADEILKAIHKLKEELTEEGKPAISIGVGINTGDVFVGNVGTENRMEYTVIGDTVNLASRIQGHNHVYRTEFLISDNTYKQVRDYVDVVKLSNVTIKGKSKPIDIYEVLRLAE
ncbi:adenylate/guanylate cyclase domain-containing protein [bacterium]|nr:adenylate/guanylate cyclase domain-containing protein [bacterium]